MQRDEVGGHARATLARRVRVTVALGVRRAPSGRFATPDTRSDDVAAMPSRGRSLDDHSIRHIFLAMGDPEAGNTSARSQRGVANGSP